MTSVELRSKFLEFFKEKGHVIIPSASLVPENDPTVLFNTAGMQPLVPYLLGEPHPMGTRLADVQKCVRTGDIDDVGDNTHLTFFEMLGNWSLGDYFKDDSITWSYEFLTSHKWLAIPSERLAVTVFAGDADADFDVESYDKWLSLGISATRIAKLGKDDNWWPAGGKHPGPQGPDTEIFYWAGSTPVPEKFDTADKNWVEIWNNVFMQFNKSTDGSYTPLAKKNVDTGMGLERTLMVLNGKDNVFEIDTFLPIMKIAQTLTNDLKKQRIISDHIRTASFMISDGVIPSNTDQGYVLRRIIRRMVFNTDEKKISKETVEKFAHIIVSIYSSIYETMSVGEEKIVSEIVTEAEKFEGTIKYGISKLSDELNTLLNTNKEQFHASDKVPGKPINISMDPLSQKTFSAASAFNYLTVYGIPLELIKAMVRDSDIELESDFDKSIEDLMKKHQDLSRAGAEQKFKGGMGDTSEASVRYHTATHLLHRALRDVLGHEVGQKGSNITPERLRFDFSFSRKMTDDEKKKVEDIVNEQIAKKLPVHKVVMPKAEAEKTGALHFFGDKYGDQVSVYYIGDSMETAYSKEFCGGPHVENIGTLGHFNIQKEEAVSAGVRRIKAILS